MTDKVGKGNAAEDAPGQIDEKNMTVADVEVGLDSEQEKNKGR